MSKPKHIAVIMDGNGRWAKNKLLPRVAGYSRGVDAARNLVKMCIDHQIPILSLFVFSSENKHRPKHEISTLMNLCLKLLTEEINQLHENNIKLQAIGDIDYLPKELQYAIKNAIQLTSNNNGLILNIAINYGGKWDLLQAVKKIATQVHNNQLSLENINEDYLAQQLSLATLPDPDLLIRTSGEQRISNFFLWQCAYTELFFTSTLWPDFNQLDFTQALEFYASRVRSFGRVLEREHA